jgi:hypothetical protein
VTRVCFPPKRYAKFQSFEPVAVTHNCKPPPSESVNLPLCFGFAARIAASESGMWASRENCWSLLVFVTNESATDQQKDQQICWLPGDGGRHAETQNWLKNIIFHLVLRQPEIF